jgi:diguanylate cyclase (GGDEF)-like protein
VNTDTAVLFIRVVGFTEFVGTYGRHGADDLLRHVVKYAKASLRVTDILFRHAECEFVGLLHQADSSTAASIGAAIRANVANHKLLLRAGDLVAVQVVISSVSSTSDGSSIRELLDSARLRLGGHSLGMDARVH